MLDIEFDLDQTNEFAGAGVPRNRLDEKTFDHCEAVLIGNQAVEVFLQLDRSFVQRVVGVVDRETGETIDLRQTETQGAVMEALEAIPDLTEDEGYADHGDETNLELDVVANLGMAHWGHRRPEHDVHEGDDADRGDEEEMVEEK
jgi:hypothetical protein